MTADGDTRLILEREAELETLRRLLDDLGRTGGHVVLIRGEAGIGKSTLISSFLAESEDRAHTLLGACDDLLTPQPLGPIWDVARQEASLAEPLASGDRRSVMETILNLLGRSLRPTILALEDTQWADEATLDLIKFVGRRISRSNGLLVLTYRDGEVDADHPLRRVIGELPTRSLVRMPLPPLSYGAIQSMIGDRELGVESILALTGGNPLFVTEVLASGVDSVPSSISDSVLARASKLSPSARMLLNLVSVVPGAAERDLVQSIAQPDQDHFRECGRQGLLRWSDRRVSFLHDLQRRAIESALTMDDRLRLNQQILDTLDDSDDPARLVHHAREAGDKRAILLYTPVAARSAMAIGSTREAVTHFRLLEPYLEEVPLDSQANILEDWGREEYFLDNAEAVGILERSIALRRDLDDVQALARLLMLASRVNRTHLHPIKAQAYAAEAVEILDQYGPTAELSHARSNHAFIEWIYTDDDHAVLELANDALALAREIDDDLAICSALITKGNLIFSHGDRSGMSLVEEAYDRAVRSGDRFQEVLALLDMTGMSGDVRDVDRAADLVQRAVSTAVRHELAAFEANALVLQAEILQWQGDWSRADDIATEVLGSNQTVETIAWRILGIALSRRSRSEARTAIERMWKLARAAGGLTMMDPSAAALAESMWLSDVSNPEMMAELTAVLNEGTDKGVPWPSGALAFWMWKLGAIDAAPPGTANFYGWIIDGNYRKAAEFWRQRKIPYEEGLALMHGDDTEQIEAIRIFERLGAEATASKVRRDLLSRGVRVPRGKSRTTRDHTAGLTSRQAEVLDLLAANLTNSEIADRLFLSPRTVENHVSAVLMKLDAPTRDIAVTVATDLGLLDHLN